MPKPNHFEYQYLLIGQGSIYWGGEYVPKTFQLPSPPASFPGHRRSGLATSTSSNCIQMYVTPQYFITTD